MKNENNEVWKDVVGYEGLYQVSNKGRVKSLWFGKERILRPGKLKKGYLMVCLCKNREKKWCLVHRLVGQAFLSNPHNLPEINHRDENKENNSVQNLEWCSVKYNNSFGTRLQRVSEKHTNGKDSKPVFQYTLDGEFVKEWKSGHDVQRNLGFNNASISRCCLGKQKSAYKFVWKYKN